MKSTITESPPREITYPCLMQSLKGMIVLFTSETEGTVIHVGEGPHFLGYHCPEWIKANDAHIWTPFTGTLTLSNS